MSLVDYAIAARLPAYPIIGLPLHIGVIFTNLVISVKSLTSWSYILLHLNGILLMAHVLFINDYADEDTDKLNDTFFNSGGSRVIANGKLTGKQLKYAAVFVGFLEIALSIHCSFLLELPHLPILAVVGCSMGWLYSLKPFRLSYHGGGELLQGISLGFVLPFFGYYFFSGTLQNYPYHTVLALLPVFSSSNIVHALPDFPSDFASNRQTFVVKYGEFMSRKTVLLSYFVSAFFAVYFKPYNASSLPYLALLAFDINTALYVVNKNLLRKSNVTTHRNECKQYVRVNMFALIGHICLWLYAYSC